MPDMLDCYILKGTAKYRVCCDSNRKQTNNSIGPNGTKNMGQIQSFLRLTIILLNMVHKRGSVINPRCACAARVTVLGLCVCVCVCVYVTTFSAIRCNETAN